MLGGLGMMQTGFPSLLQAADSMTLPFARGERPLRAFPQKRPLMVMTTRPPQLETPFLLFDEQVFTPNDVFFVRWHLANIPTSLDPASFRLHIRGKVGHTLSLTLQDLKDHFQAVDLPAVCQCAGNSRGFFEPRVPGGQWGHGAMGNAVWTGARLRDLLQRAGIRDGARFVRFNGLDQPVVTETPDFQKSLSFEHVFGEDVLVAYAMNGKPLPWLNGYPLRLVVPGWYATYWIKMLHDIEVLDEADTNFWTKQAYRIPADPCACVEPGNQPDRTVPIGRMTVRSFITNVQDGAKLSGGSPTQVRGIAFDQGYGIQQVLVSWDGGETWNRASLGKDYGKYSFRPWTITFTPRKGITYHLQSLAMNRIGQAQRMSARWNPSGYMRNTVETIQAQGV